MCEGALVSVPVWRSQDFAPRIFEERHLNLYILTTVKSLIRAAILVYLAVVPKNFLSLSCKSHEWFWRYVARSLPPAGSQDIDLSCHVPISTFRYAVWSQSTNVTDGRTDGRQKRDAICYAAACRIVGSVYTGMAHNPGRPRATYRDNWSPRGPLKINKKRSGSTTS